VAGRFKAFAEKGFTPIFREKPGKKDIRGKKKMASYRYYSTINLEEKKAAKAAKEKNKRYILYRLPAGKRFRGGLYGWKCVDKNSWGYWEYYCSPGSPGTPGIGVPALICVFMIWLLYRLFLHISRLSLCGLKIIFSTLAAKPLKRKKIHQE
jgi:hypothetical protein